MRKDERNTIEANDNLVNGNPVKLGKIWHISVVLKTTNERVELRQYSIIF